MEQKLATDLQNLFGAIIKNPSSQTRDELMGFSNMVLNSLIGSQPQEDIQNLKQRCLKRANIIYNGDSKTTLKCQQLLSKITGSRSLTRKAQALKLIVKISQYQNLNNNSSVNLDNTFKSQALRKPQLDITTTSIRQQLDYNQKVRILPEKLAIIRNRGSPEQSASQNDILRQLIFAMQNIFGNLITSPGGDSLSSLKPYLNVSQPVRKITMQLAQLGWLYKKITMPIMDIGQVRSSFEIGIKSQLDEFYRWIAIIQSLLKQNQLNLRKLVMWSIEPFQRFKWLAILSEAVAPYRGTKIISIINSYRPHGDHFIMQLLNRLLLHVIEPLFNFIEMWVYRGELSDPYGQYFIGEDPKTGSDNFWQRKYRLVQQNVPNIMGMQNARIVFNIGKTINFLKRCCDHEFQIQQVFINKQTIFDSKCFAISFSSQFTQWLNRCSNIVNKQLMRVLFNKFKLKDHLDAIRRFLLMSQGDFIQVLLDTLGEELNNSPAQIYKHNLNNKLEKALATSNAQYLSQDVTARVIVQLLQGSDGWDNFMLTYAVDQPINTLLTPKIMKEGYLGIFGFLWKLKRVQRSLNLVWTDHVKEIRRRSYRLDSESQTSNKIKRCFVKYDKLFKQCSILRSSMQHFVNSLYSYIILTIEASWNKFIETLQTAANFDEILKLHEELVVQLRQICFLEHKNKSIQAASLSLFQQILNFKYRQQSLLQNYKHLKQLSRQAQINRQLGSSSTFNQNSVKNLINDQTKRLYQTREHFNKVLMDFMLMLSKQGQKYKVISFKQDFNQYYKTMPLRKEMR